MINTGRYHPDSSIKKIDFFIKKIKWQYVWDSPELS